ncbi:glycosyl transferase family 1 [Acrocarpospora pleiomorpha]|uniref:Glycosyl transferase family 1 n=1 Tax=Acrocarpospora pleiomorpha TaxID=90975 RepID=A0A5M3XQD2_9ACTN|nr:glycosyltransferase [Acrocarpospora pleiomorpha]GES23525.1 glycosyl transferase family 1 [Acrocarpospora pleiomorpha]
MSTVVFASMDADTLGGIQRVVHTVAQGLAERGHEVHVVGLHRSGDPITYVTAPHYSHHVISPGPKRSPWARRRTAALLNSLEPGYVVMTSPGVVARMKDLLRLHQGIGQYHGSFAHARGCWHYAAVKAHYGTLDQAVFLSPDDAWQFSEHALLPNTWHIPNPLPDWPPETSPLDRPRVLAVGRLAGVKRFDRLISAFGRTGRSDWELHLVGDGPDAGRLMVHAVTEGVADRVRFRGRIPAGEMAAEYRAASLAALSSDHEGLPLVLAEAASHGLPAVAFDVSGGVRHLVRDGETGLLAPPGDVAALAAALSTLMADTRKRRRLGAAARGHARQFKLPNVVDRWEELFTHLRR